MLACKRANAEQDFSMDEGSLNILTYLSISAPLKRHVKESDNLLEHRDDSDGITMKYRR